MIKKLYSSSIPKDDKNDSGGDDDKEMFKSGKEDILEEVNELDKDKSTRLNAAILDRQVHT